MQKRIIIFLILVLLLPLCVYAETFVVPETDIILTLDEETWAIFTRRTIKNKELLAEYGMSYEETNKFFLSNNVYLYSFADLDTDAEMDNTIEFYIYKSEKKDDVKSLSELTKENIEEIENELVKSNKATKHDYYTSDVNSYIYYEFNDKDTYIYSYYTVINGSDYFLNFRTTVPLDDVSGMDSIIDSVLIKPDYNINVFETIVYAIISLTIIVFVVILVKKRMS